MPENYVPTPGARVWVDDPGLAELRRIMREATGTEPPPNHTGTVDSVEDGLVYIIFDDSGSEAPYPVAEVHPLEEADA
jgi:hypothetical protein